MTAEKIARAIRTGTGQPFLTACIVIAFTVTGLVTR